MKRSIVVLGILAASASVLMVGRLLAPNGFDPSTTIKFGEAFEEHNRYAAGLLGEIVVAPMAGHDGRFFFTQAMDPFYLEPEVHSKYLDRPTYRAQRMAYPTLASLGGMMSAEAIAWNLIVVNILAMVVGTVYTGLTAVQMGLSPWFGFAFVANPGLIVDLGIDGAGIVATAAMMVAVYYLLREELWPAAIAITVASLARETMLIAAAGLAVFYWYKKRRVPLSFLLPVLSVSAWWFYVHWRLDDGFAQDTQALALPFVGFVEAFAEWIDTPGSGVDLAVGCILLVVAVVVVLRSVEVPTALGWAVSGFALLAVVMSAPVWENWFDSARALAPVLTAYLLLGPAVAKMEDGSAEMPDSVASST